MTRLRVQLEPAWVLRASAYGDTSQLVEALTQHHGRVGLVARGARAARSKLRGLLQPFHPLLLSWTESGDLGTLTGAEAAGAAVALPGETVFSGWYLNELLLRLLQRHDAHAEIFEAYGRALSKLVGATEAALRGFELRLLAELGFGLDLPEDLDAGLNYRYASGQGAVPVAADFAAAVPGSALIALRDEQLQRPEDLRVARRLLSGALAEHLGDRPLATATMLRDLRRRSLTRPA